MYYYQYETRIGVVTRVCQSSYTSYGLLNIASTTQMEVA